MSGNRFNKDFQPLTDTTTAPIGLFSATASGTAMGIAKASKAITDAIGVSTEQLSYRNHLIAVLDALIKRQEDPGEIEALKMFGELKESLNGTAKVVGSSVSAASIAPSATLIETSQLAVDSVLAGSAVSQSTDPKKFTKFQASTLNVRKELATNANGFSEHCKNLSDEFKPIFDEMSRKVDENELNDSHDSIAKSTGSISVTTILTPAALVSLGLDALGSVFRECSAIKIFSSNETGSEEEKNIYKALSICSEVFTQSNNFAASLKALKALRDAILNFRPATNMSERHCVSSPLTTAMIRSLISTPFVLALESVISSGEAISLSSEVLTQQKQALSESVQQSIPKASSIKGQSEGGHTHSQNITFLTDQFTKVIKAIDDEVIANDKQRSVVEMSASLSVGIISALAEVPSLMTALIGILSREASGAMDFTQHDSGTIDRLMEASQSDINHSAKALDNLMKQVSDLKNQIERCKELGVSSPFVLGLSQMLSFVLMYPAVSALQSSIASIAGVEASSEAMIHQKDRLMTGTKESIENASTLKKGGAEKHTHSLNLSNLTDNFARVVEQIDVELKEMEGERHKSSAIVTGASSIRTISALAAIPLLMTDLSGALSREATGTLDCMTNDKVTHQAFTNVLQADTNHSAHDLDELRRQVSNLDQRIKKCKELGVSAPFVLGTSQMVSFGLMLPAVSALQSSIASLAGVRASSIALINEDDLLTKGIKQSIGDASTVNQHVQTHCQNLTELIDNCREVSKQIESGLQDMPKDRHKVSARSTGVASIGTLSALSAIPNVLIAATGILSREMSGVADFIKNDNVTHQAFTNVLKSDKDHTGKHLDDLMSAVCDMKERVEKCQQLGVSAPFILGTGHVVSCGSLIASLNAIAGMCFALRELRSFTHPDASDGLKLNEEEKQEAKQYEENVVQSNQESAASSKTQSVSKHLSLHDHLQSIMEKIVLTHRVSFADFRQGEENINQSGHSLINLTQMNTTGFLSGALGVLASVSLECGISIEAFWRAFRLATEKSNLLSKGPDEIKMGHTSQLNPSALCNLTRLAADQSEDPSSCATQTSLSTIYHVSETTFSRSLIIAICQSGALTQALKELSKEVDIREGEDPQYVSGSSHISGRIKSERLAEKIKEVLDRAGNDIPGLNHDMANQLASASHASITAALSADSVSIGPFLQSYLVAKHAIEKINKEQKNEGLSESSIVRELSTASNIIRAFTKNCIDQLKQNSDQISAGQQEEYNASMEMHIKSNASLASTMVATCYISLLCDDLVESIVSRSLGFLDAEKMKITAKQSEVVSSAEAKESLQQTANDSNLSKSKSATLTISALRLTLTNLAESLAGMASELEKQFKDMKLLKEKGMPMHTSQQSMLETLISALSGCSLSVTKTACILPMLPLSSLGYIDDMRHIVRSIDSVRANHSDSAEQTRKDSEGSESSVSFGMTIDSTMATILLFVKSLLKGLVVGSESALLVSKILEILSLHQRPDKDLSLLLKELLQPEGGSTGLTKLVESHLTGATVGVSAIGVSVLDDTNTSDSKSMKTTRDSLQKIIDKLIDACGFLEDDEENKQMKLGLKKLFECMIIVLAKDSNEFKFEDMISLNAESLVEMLDRGSIALASSHSKTNMQNPLIPKGVFLGCNDAQVLLETFIKKASVDQAKGIDLMNALKEELSYQGKECSTKVENLWEYILKKVSDNLHEKNRRTKFFDLANGKHQNPPRQSFDAKVFRKACALDLHPQGYSPSFRN